MMMPDIASTSVLGPYILNGRFVDSFTFLRFVLIFLNTEFYLDLRRLQYCSVDC